jgi:hypothetical protein
MAGVGAVKGDISCRVRALWRPGQAHVTPIACDKTPILTARCLHGNHLYLLLSVLRLLFLMDVFGHQELSRWLRRQAKRLHTA